MVRTTRVEITADSEVDQPIVCATSKNCRFTDFVVFTFLFDFCMVSLLLLIFHFLNLFSLTFALGPADFHGHRLEFPCLRRLISRP